MMSLQINGKQHLIDMKIDMHFKNTKYVILRCDFQNMNLLGGVTFLELYLV